MLSGLSFGLQAQDKKEENKQSSLQKDKTDPICGMKVTKNSSILSIYEGKEYAFCSKMCQAQFEKNPKKYSKK